MTYYEERFVSLSSEEKDSILEFLDCLTEGDIQTLGREMQMFPSDIRKLCKAFDTFQNG